LFVVAVTGTGTDIGKTWVTAAVARLLRARGVRVAARKPAQSFAPSDPLESRDASVLAAATGVRADDVCPPHRNYERALAPPMAAAALGREPIRLRELLDELRWPSDVDIDIGFVETAGGVRSPIADDADNVALVDALHPDLVLLVADAGLGTLNLVRLSVGVLASGGHRCVVFLNRFDPADELHRANLDWLTERDGLDVVTSVEELAFAQLWPA
jgi:dethiobiotin synthetase